jgi:hypothetical protein
MCRTTAVLVGSSALAMTLSGAAHAQVRTAARPDADRKAERPAVRPARVPELVYLNAEGGYETFSINTLTAGGSLPAGTMRPVSASTSSGGPLIGIGGGFRFGFLTLGGRVRGAHLTMGDLSTIDGELGARMTFYRVEPYFTFAGGYAKLRATGSQIAGIVDLNIHGWNARGGLGVDYYANKNFTIGANLTGDVIAMARPGVDLSTSPETQARERVATCQGLTNPAEQEQCARNVIHDAEGTSTGFAGTMSLVMGLHF